MCACDVSVNLANVMLEVMAVTAEQPEMLLLLISTSTVRSQLCPATPLVGRTPYRAPVWMLTSLARDSTKSFM